MRSILIGNNFQAAAREYFWLLNRGYPEKRSRLLVCDRYRLNRHQRTALYRGIFPDAVNQRRIVKNLQGPPEAGSTVVVDLLNNLFLVANYLYGRNVFLSTDLLIRDDGENFSRIRNPVIIRKAFRLFVNTLDHLEISRAVLLIDKATVACDLDFLLDAGTIAGLLARSTGQTEVRYSDHVDHELISSPEHLAATSDSRVADRFPNRLIDLAAHTLSLHFDVHIPDLYSIVYANWEAEKEKTCE